MRNRIGIRREDKSLWERRVPLTPAQIRLLQQEHGITFEVQSSSHRVFTDEEFEKAGVRVAEDLSQSNVILGVKEIPVEILEADKVYFFFAHVIKGQPYNMAMLQRLLDLGCTLLDYERVVDAQNRRLIAFGRFAGLAGMIDTLWALGRRLEWEGIESPFVAIEKAIDSPDLEGAKRAIRRVGEHIQNEGLPRALCPWVCGFAGYGNVSQGAQEIFDLLPVVEIDPESLLHQRLAGPHANRVYKVVFKEEHLVQPLAAGDSFRLQEYYEHPERYRSRFEPFLEHLTVLMNCIYWEARYPRLVTKSALEKMQFSERPQRSTGSETDRGGPPRLRVIGDISCDLNGAIEVTVKATTPGDPVYVYEPESQQIHSGWEGRGPVILAVDILPTELPAEASAAFGAALGPLMPALAQADFDVSFEALALPAELKRAVIVHKGQLTPDYSGLRRFLDFQGG